MHLPYLRKIVKVHFHPLRLRLHCFFFQFEGVALKPWSLRLYAKHPGACFFDNLLIWQWQFDQELQKKSHYSLMEMWMFNV